MRYARVAMACVGLVGCSARGSALLEDGGGTDGTEVGADGDWLCPGHWDPCLEPHCNSELYPYFTIKTSDGFPSISSARIVSGGCTVNMSIIPDGGAQGIATLEVGSVTYPCLLGPCTVHLTLTDGRTVEVVADLYQGADVTYRHCARNTNCCDRSEYSESTVPTCYFSPSEVQVDIAATNDGGGSAD